MRHLTIWMFAISLLAACATATTDPSYERELETWIGKPVERLVSSWGAPTSTWVAPSGATVLTWKRQGIATMPGKQTVTAGMYGSAVISGGPAVYSKFCTTSFTASPSGIVNDWSYEGNGC